MRKRMSDVIVWFITALLVAFGAYCVICVAQQNEERKSNESVLEEVRESFYIPVENNNEEVDLPEEDLHTRYNAMKDINSDYVAWIRIPGTNVDYPVVMADESNPYWYLKHNFKGKYDVYGTPYVIEPNTVNDDNVIIYAHNMRDGSMFGSLKKYRDEDWAMQNRLIELITDNKHLYYEVIAVLTQDAYDPDIVWSDHIVFRTQGQSFYYGYECCSRSIIDFDYEPTGDDNYITLVTCEYSTPNGRLLVVGRQLKE